MQLSRHRLSFESCHKRADILASLSLVPLDSGDNKQELFSLVTVRTK